MTTGRINQIAFIVSFLNRFRPDARGRETTLRAERIPFPGASTSRDKPPSDRNRASRRLRPGLTGAENHQVTVCRAPARSESGAPFTRPLSSHRTTETAFAQLKTRPKPPHDTDHDSESFAFFLTLPVPGSDRTSSSRAPYNNPLLEPQQEVT